MCIRCYTCFCRHIVLAKIFKINPYKMSIPRFFMEVLLFTIIIKYKKPFSWFVYLSIIFQKQFWFGNTIYIYWLNFCPFFSPVRSVVIVAPGDPIPPNLPPQQKLQLQQMSSDHPPPPMQASEAAAAATADSAAFAMASHSEYTNSPRNKCNLYVCTFVINKNF